LTDIILLIIDELHTQTLAEFRFRWHWLEPFYQYHLNLINIPKQQQQQPIHLYISLMRKESSLSKEDIRYFGLEILINQFDVPIPKKQSLYCVARIVPNYNSYKHDYLRNANNHQYVGVDFHRITYPNPTDFVRPEYTLAGYPQLSLASKESKIPRWMHDFLFSRDHEKDNMFLNNSAFVLEFYPFRAVDNSTTWRIKDLVGWVAIRLDQRTYDALTAPGSVEGMRTEGLLVESDGDLIAESSKYLTAELLLKLVAERHPSKNLIAFNASNLPILPSYYVEGSRQSIYIQMPVAPRRSFLPSINSATSVQNFVPTNRSIQSMN
ncbi:unnamed protein product, partial [Didymodactylos carnosus]